MSYCVNCGVELDASAKACPLCHVPVINPAQPAETPIGPYPNRVERIFERIDRRYGVALASCALAIPVICSLLIDFLTSGRLSWSGYVAGGVICVFVFFLLPLLRKRVNLYLQLLYDNLAVQAYLAAIFNANETMSAYVTFAMPIALAAGIFTYAGAAVLQMKALRGKLHKPALLVLLLALFLLTTECVIDLNLYGTFRPFWSLIAAIPCAVSALMLFLLESKKDVKNKIIRRLFM